MRVSGSAPNSLHRPGRETGHWSTANVGEAVPGVLTPLVWTIWERTGDRGLRDLSFALGIFDRSERDGPAPGEDPIIQVFFGRIAMSMDWLGLVGDRMPGTTGEQAIKSILGRTPDTMSFRPTIRRYPVIAWKLPVAMVRTPRQITRLAATTEQWWRETVPGLPQADEAHATAVLVDAERRFNQVTNIHAIGLFAAVTPLIEALTKIVGRAGTGDVGALSGAGGAEMKVVEDIWRASRDEITVADVVAMHGYHGPLEGEIASRVWREDSTPLEHLVATYRGRDESENPVRRDTQARERLPHLQAEVLRALPRWQRPFARVVLRRAASTIPLRGVGKASFLQAMDVMRAAARRLGVLLTETGRIGHPDDVFYLTFDELAVSLPANLPELVAERRRIRQEYQSLRLPASWRGTPVPISETDDEPGSDIISGIGASAGVVEGRVRVVTDPGFGDVEPGEILVSHTTDPSWASIMFVSDALVVDVGGMLSHAAVVARELGIPCVVNTRTATDRLRDGDHVRVDGSSGTVEILSRAT